MMKVAGVEKVAIAVVHKEFDDDVLVANMRGLLPAWLSATAMDEAPLSGDERELLREAYAIERFDLPGHERQLGLRSLPPVVTGARAAELASEPREALMRHYTLSGEQWRLHSLHPSELDHVTLMSHLADRSQHLTDADRYRLSQVLDKLPGLQRPKVSCFNMVMDTNNYFFYRKHHEHVPGIMLIEVVRQAMYAQYYCHSTVAKGQVSLTIENLNVSFMGFVNANYPLRIQVEDQRPPERIASEVFEERVATFSQLGRVVAVATMRANPIKMNLFKRLRNVKPSASARFIPTKNIAPVGVFVWSTNTAMEGRIHDVSSGGIKASFDADAAIGVGAQAHFSMFVEGIGFINATVTVRWLKLDGERLHAGFQMTEMDGAATLRLRDAIKNYTFVDTRRGEC